LSPWIESCIGRKLAVCTAELFQKHVAEPNIGFIDAHREHELFYMMVHWETLFRMKGDVANGPAPAAFLSKGKIARTLSDSTLR
jgi:hypothetical protein